MQTHSISTIRERLILGLAVLTALALVPAASARQSASPQSQSSQQEDPLAAAARKAKEQQSHEKRAKVFTNDNLPTDGVISTVGTAPAAASKSSPSGKPPAVATAANSAQGEQYWRDKFASLNKKLEQDQAELDVMQRELGQLNLQNYSDPNKAMQQGYSHADIDKKTAEISTQQKQIDADKQAISDAETDLRRSGGDAGWAR